MKAFHEVRNYDSDYMVWHSRYDNIGFLAHWHKEIELIYVRSGSCLLSVTDQTFLARTGDLAVCESGMIHYSDSHGMDNSLDFIIFDDSRTYLPESRVRASVGDKGGTGDSRIV